LNYTREPWLLVDFFGHHPKRASAEA